MNKKTLQKAITIDDLKDLGIGVVVYEIGHRGGGIGFYARDVAAAFKVPVEYLPNKYGAGCNYLGGGVRGSVFPSGFSKAITGRKAALLQELGNACVRAYKDAEGAMNEEVDEEGEINWEAKATNAARRAGIKSAY